MHHWVQESLGDIWVNPTHQKKFLGLTPSNVKKVFIALKIKQFFKKMRKFRKYKIFAIFFQPSSFWVFDKWAFKYISGSNKHPILDGSFPCSCVPTGLLVEKCYHAKGTHLCRFYPYCKVSVHFSLQKPNCSTRRILDIVPKHVDNR